MLAAARSRYLQGRAGIAGHAGRDRLRHPACCPLLPSLTRTVSNLSASANPNTDEVNYSHRISATPRMVRFQEMEYNIPAEHVQAVIREMQECIALHRFKVHFPIECRFVHAD